MIKAVEIAIGIIVLYFLIAGIRKGLIRQVLEVVGIVAAFVCSFYLANRLALYLEPRIDLSYNLSLVISAAIIFVGVIIAFHYLGLALKKFLDITLLGAFDKVMGGVFGAVKGLLLCSLLLVILLALPLPGGFKKELKSDPVVGYVEPLLPVLYEMFFSDKDLDFDRLVKSRGEFLDRAREKSEQIKKKSRRISDEIKESVEDI